MESIEQFRMRMDQRRIERAEWWKELDRPNWERFLEFVRKHREAIEKGIN